VSVDPESPSPFAAVLAAYRGKRRPRRNVRVLRTPTGFVEIRFWSNSRAWIQIYDDRGWPSRRLTRWATRDRHSLARALRRGGFAPAEADRLAEEISDDWGEPIGDVAEVLIPTAVAMTLTAIGAVSVGRWLLRRVTEALPFRPV
jgi:hypothetical protein